jgi:two-component sensor histidine kinase
LDQLAYQIINNALQMVPSASAITVEMLSFAEDGLASAAPVMVNFKQAYDLAIVFNELATNTAKHGLCDREVGKIQVDVTQEGPWIEVCFRNDGPDYPDEVLDLAECNIGLHLVETIVSHDMHGELHLENDNGAVTRIRFKADETTLGATGASDAE